MQSTPVFKLQLEILDFLQQSGKQIIIIYHYHVSTISDYFKHALTAKIWVLSNQCIEYTKFGDSIASTSSFLFGMNSLVLGSDHLSSIQIIRSPVIDTTHIKSYSP